MGLMGIEMVHEFHEKFGLPLGDKDMLMENPEAINFRGDFMQEELDEFHEAVAWGDNVKAFDALLDLAYVVYGTALFMGITPDKWRRGLEAVHRANMAKVRAQSSSDSKRGTTFDVVKPEGWTGPEEELAEILICQQ